MRDLILGSIVLLIAVTMLANTNPSHAMTEDNPLLANWEGPYGGIPPFDRVQIPLFKPALEAGMAENLAEIQRIANDPAPPSFENTIVAMERSGQALDRVATLYGVWGATMSSPDYQVVQREMAALTVEQWKIIQAAVGMTVIEIERVGRTGEWQLVRNGRRPYNRRVTASDTHSGSRLNAPPFLSSATSPTFGTAWYTRVSVTIGDAVSACWA